MKLNQFIFYLLIVAPSFSNDYYTIQSNYKDSEGKPSHKVFLKSHGITKQNST